jgi:serine/threonine protein kinase
MNAAADCPDASLLAQLLAGTLPQNEQALVADHLQTCERCQREIERQAAGTATWDALARELRSLSKPPPPPLAAAMDALKTQARKEEPVLAQVSPDLPRGFLAPAHAAGNLGRLGDYEVIEEIGRGAMGVVLRALDERLNRVVALKVMSPELACNGQARQRFKREARAAAAVCHEHVVTIYAVEEAAGLPYLVMQYIAGRTLEQRIDQGGPLRVAEILRIGMQAAAGLAAAHAQGLVHRDIKPANLLLENGVERVKLTDFGLARSVDDASLTQSGVITGTPQFMAPEQARGEALDARADLFSLGCVLYMAATGRPPFRAPTTLAVLKRICEDEPRPIRELNPEIPQWLAAIVGKLLAKDPADRYQSASELANLLGQCLAHVQQPERVPLPTDAAALANRLSPGSTSIRSSDRMSPWAVLLVMVMLALLLLFALPGMALVAWFFHKSESPRASSLRDPPGLFDSSARPIASQAELQELDRLVGIAQKQWLLAQDQHERGTMSQFQVILAELEFVGAKVRYARMAQQLEEVVSLLKQRVAIKQSLLKLSKQRHDAGQITMTQVLDAEKGLSEAKLLLQRAEEDLAREQ